MNNKNIVVGHALLGIKGPATLMIQNPIVKHMTHSATNYALSWLHEAGLVIVDLSYGICLVGCAVLIILVALGMKDGYRWAGMTFGIFSLIRLFGGGKL